MQLPQSPLPRQRTMTTQSMATPYDLPYMATPYADKPSSIAASLLAHELADSRTHELATVVQSRSVQEDAAYVRNLQTSLHQAPPFS
jgi:hypothetical protein